MEGAQVIFRLNHGNLVQMGSKLISSSIRNLDPNPNISVRDAWEILFNRVGRSAEDMIAKPELHIVPVMRAAGLLRAAEGNPDIAPPGGYLDYRLVYTLQFQRPGSPATWTARIDAHTGEMLSFTDETQYGQAHGAPYYQDRPTPPADRPFPFIDIDGGAGNQFADAGGIFPGNTASSTMRGQFVRINSECGAILLNVSNGDLDFGQSGQIGCASSPGVGGPGNTNASRTQFYGLNFIFEKARSYLPNNTFLAEGNVLALVDQTATSCNATSGGTILTFYAATPICANTGELPGISWHEFGHTMDGRDGIPSQDGGTGETYGDVTAFLQTHASCIGNGFNRSGNNCFGYGDLCTNCSGVRDVDFAAHVSGQPHTTLNFAGPAGPNGGCGTASSCQGPCGTECHCESYVSSEAIWDIANRDLPAMGLDPATSWQILDRLWYTTRPTAGSAYSCDQSTFNSNGCGVDNFYQVFLVADDCDGDLSNGTPHMPALFAAFDRHGIACATPTVKQQKTCCASLATPTMTTTPGNNFVGISWNAVAGATFYDIYRNETSCSAGFTRVGRVQAPVTYFADNTAVNGITYYYRMQAATSGICTTSFSACASETPVGAPSAKYVSGSATAAAGVGGDNDAFLDNCENSNVDFVVVNDGNVPLTNVSATITPASPNVVINTSMPIALGSLAVGATTNGTVNISPDEAYCGDTLRLRIDLTSTQQQSSSSNTSAVFDVPADIEFDVGATVSVGHSFETNLEGWTAVNFTVDNSVASDGSRSLHSTDGVDNTCDSLTSLPFQATATSSMSVDVRYDIEAFSGQWWDRANVHVVNLNTGVHTYVTPTGTPYEATADSTNFICHVDPDTEGGWAGMNPSWPAFDTATFDLSSFAGQVVQVEFNFATDGAAVGTGFWVDDIQFTDIQPRICDAQACGEAATAEVITGYGPNQSSPAVWTVWAHDYTTKVAETAAYGSGYGSNVGGGDINADGMGEIISGPGPSPVNGPHVRGWTLTGPIAKVNFFAYGTLKFGAKVRGYDLDADLIDEIGTGPGPGAVFGPHVRAWNFDGTSISAITSVNFFAYGTLKFGVNHTGAQLNGSASPEIATGAGPGAVFAATVRGFDWTSVTVRALNKINYNAFSSNFGVRIGASDVDIDGYQELVTGPGPNVNNVSDLTVWNYDDASISRIETISPFTSMGGALVSGGDFFGGAPGGEILTSRGGHNTSATSEIKGYRWSPANGLVAIPPDFTPYTGDNYGTTLGVSEVGDH